MPNMRISPEEKDVWQDVRQGKVDPLFAHERLSELRDEHDVQLSEKSRELLSLQDPDEIRQFVSRQVGFPEELQTLLTCMSVLNKDKEDHDSIGCLVLGSDQDQALHLLEPSAAKIMRRFDLPSVPFMICCSGRYDVDYRIVVACRNGKVYIIRNHELSGVVIELESIPCAIVQYDRNISVACMDSNILVFSQRGKKQYSIYTGQAIKDMRVLDMRAFNNMRCIVVALGNRELRVYNGSQMVDSVETADTVTGMTYGIYGSEPNALVLSYRNGGIEFKIVARKAAFDARSQSGPPPEQDIPLSLPRRTSLYVELTEREKQQATDMHRIFQHDLCKLRVTSSRAFLRVLSEGQGPISFTTGSQLRLNASVQGLGPLFKIKLQIHNTGTRPKYNIPVVFAFNTSIYSMQRPRIIIPTLIPSLQYRISAEIEQIDEEAGADTVKVFLLNTQGSVPLLTALLQMPLMANMSEI